jgi:hypothetical protein
MAEENITPEKGAEGFTDAEKHNAEAAQKLADQNKPKLTTAEDLADTGGALDKLAAEKQKPAEEVVVELDDEAKKKAEADAKAVEEKSAADKAASDAREADLKKADEFFKDSPALPPNASPKSSEAFSHVKIKAAQEISAREAKIVELEKKVKESDEKLKNPVPPETEAELKELREWRAKLDVDADPKFKEFDKTITASHDFIYAQLKKSPAVTDKVIEEIKKYGGPENVNMTKLFESIKDPTMQRLVEAKISDIEMAKFNKEQAIKAAKENIGQYVSERQKASTEAATAHNKSTAKYLEQLHTQTLSWLEEKPADPKADDAGKKVIEEHNKFVKETKESMAAALSDDSAEMRAIMIAGMAQLFHTRRDRDALKAQLDAKVPALEKTVKELEEKLARFKQSSVSRLRETGAPADGKLPKSDKEPDIFKPATQALDDIARQIREEKAAAGK